MTTKSSVVDIGWSAPRIPPSDEESLRGLWLLIFKGLRCLLNYRFIFREQSRFKIAFSTGFMTLTMTGLFFVFYAGFVFLNEIGGVGVMIINRLFALFYFGLGILLILSSVITSYSTLYQSPEMAYLVLRPLHIRDIITYKYIETFVMSSWAFFFIIVPFVAAYSVFEKLSLLFALWTLVFSVPFALICCALGTLITFLIVRFLPRGRTLFVLVTAFLGVVSWALLRAVQGVLLESGTDHMLLLSKLIPGFQLTSHPLWPSYWVTEGMMTMSRAQWGRGALFFALACSWVLVLAILVREVGAAIFYTGWQRMMSSASRMSNSPAMLRPVEWVLARFTPMDFRALFMKDVRVFLRDPAQWSQGLIFYGILALYFINLRNLQYHTLSDEWRNAIAFLNVFSVSAVMCSLGARFIYPQLSLEGQGFWIVGMSPLTMGRVLASKFLAALTILIVVSLSLMYLSVQMLQVDGEVAAAAMTIAVAMSFAIAGMSTGFGGVFMDLKQRNPAAIISSFGGTLNLVMSLGFMFLSILPFAAIYHMVSGSRISEASLQAGAIVAYVYLLVLTAMATTIPLALGRRRLNQREY
jgi:ABC-2 type transport system permease protein